MLVPSLRLVSSSCYMALRGSCLIQELSVDCQVRHLAGMEAVLQQTIQCSGSSGDHFPDQNLCGYA